MNNDLFQQTLEEYTEQQKYLRNEILESFFSFVRKNLGQELIGIQWTQYIPRFNDGDVCEFQFGYVNIIFNHKSAALHQAVIEDAIYFQGEEYSFANEDSLYTWDYESRKKVFQDPKHEKWLEFIDQLNSMMGSLKHEFQTKFGINAQITLLIDTVIVEEYDCGY
jgi:hypothetical protein